MPAFLVSEWAEKHRVLAEDEAEPVEEQIPHDPAEVIRMKAAQIGGLGVRYTIEVLSRMCRRPTKL